MNSILAQGAVRGGRSGERAAPVGGRAVIALLVAGAFLVLVSAAAGQGNEAVRPGDPAAEGQPLVTNMFYETSIRQALSDISAQTGVIIVPDMSVHGIITCELQDVSLDRALEIILSAGSFEFRHEDGYMLVGSTDPESPAFARLCEVQVIKLNYAEAMNAVRMLSTPLQEYAKADETSNTICVTAPPRLLRRIVGHLELLDRAPRQVMIEAKVVELEERTMWRFGMDWNYEWGVPQEARVPRSGRVTFAPVDWALGVAVRSAGEHTHNVALTLELLRSNEFASIIANPHVVAVDGTEAEIKVTTEEYFEISTETAYVRADLEVIESGIVLQMLPRIGENGEITMQVTPDVSNVIGQGTKGLPVITRRRASTTVRVHDGGTIIIGGLLDSRARFEETRIPVLGDIPLLGWLFRKRTTLGRNRQVAVFITPRIVQEPGTPEALLSGLPRRPPQIEPVGAGFQRELEQILEGLRLSVAP